MTMELGAVRAAVTDVVHALFATDPLEARFVRSRYPCGYCEYVAVPLAAVLEDRGLGQWTLVTAGRPGPDRAGHAWLEWRTADGEVVFSIDPTVHQFEHLATGPFVDYGQTPAARDFTRIRSVGPVWLWPELGDEAGYWRGLIRAVQGQLPAS